MKSKKFLALALAAISVGTMAAFASCGEGGTSTGGGDSTGNSTSGNSGATGTLSGTVSLTGSTSMEELMRAIAAKFEAIHTGVTVNISCNGSGTGISDAISGRNDIGLSSRDLSSSEISQGAKAVQLATDGIAIIVNPSCTVSNVTADEIYNLYVHGTTIQETISRAITREEGSGTRGAFDELVVNTAGEALEDALELADCVQEQTSTGNVITQISTAGATNLIGYVSLGAVTDAVKAVKYNDVEATVENIVAGDYALSRPFNLVLNANEELSPVAQAFYDYLFTDEIQDFIEEEGYIRA